MIPPRWPPPVGEPRLFAKRPLSGRLSMSLLQREDSCPRSAYLSLKYRDRDVSHAMHRGSLFHLFQAAAIETLVSMGEPNFLVAAQRQLEADFVAEQDREVSSGQEAEVILQRARGMAAEWSAAIVDEQFRAHPELVVPRAELDRTREMAFHWAVGYDVDAEQVVGWEQKLVLELRPGVTVSGVVDVLWGQGDVLCVDDAKTSFSLPAQEDIDHDFQLWMYGALVAFGRPVMEVPCRDCMGRGWRPIEGTFSYAVDAANDKPGSRVPCSACEARGVVEEVDTPIGDRTQWFRLRQTFPRYLGDDGLVRSKSVNEGAPVSRTQLRDFLADVEMIAERLEGRFESGRWPAVPGSHCSICPAVGECPLPGTLRDYAGLINSAEDAAAALEVVEAEGAVHKAVKEEVRRWAERGGPVRVGKDLIYDWSAGDTTRTDYAALEAAIARTVDTGLDGDRPFSMERYRKTTASATFKRRRLKKGEVAA